MVASRYGHHEEPPGTEQPAMDRDVPQVAGYRRDEGEYDGSRQPQPPRPADYTPFLEFRPHKGVVSDPPPPDGHMVPTFSPDVIVVGPEGPTSLSSPPVPGESYQVSAHVHNNGRGTAMGVVVRFWDVDIGPLGVVDVDAAELIGETVAMIPGRTTVTVECPNPWVPHQPALPILVDASLPGVDPILHPFDPIRDRHVAVTGGWPFQAA